MRWPVRGVRRCTPRLRRSKPRGPVATGSRQVRDTSRLAAAPYLRANGQALLRLTAVGRPRHTAPAEGVLKTPTTGGARGASLKHRARDAEGLADLRFQDSRAAMPDASPLRLGVARCRGPWVCWIHGVPRALGLMSAAVHRTTRARRGENREAERWLSPLCHKIFAGGAELKNRSAINNCFVGNALRFGWRSFPSSTL